MMNNKIRISIALIILGFVFECIHFFTDIHFFELKFWILGILCLTLGVLGGLWFGIIPVLEERASKIGKFKRKNLTNDK